MTASITSIATSEHKVNQVSVAYTAKYMHRDARD
jgi:hypothetical protein